MLKLQLYAFPCICLCRTAWFLSWWNLLLLYFSDSDRWFHLCFMCWQSGRKSLFSGNLCGLRVMVSLWVLYHIIVFWNIQSSIVWSQDFCTVLFRSCSLLVKICLAQLNILFIDESQSTWMVSTLLFRNLWHTQFVVPFTTPLIMMFMLSPSSLFSSKKKPFQNLCFLAVSVNPLLISFSGFGCWFEIVGIYSLMTFTVLWKQLITLVFLL